MSEVISMTLLTWMRPNPFDAGIGQTRSRRGPDSFPDRAVIAAVAVDLMFQLRAP